ncbi:MAG: YdeI/OmpD-associated family protein [Methylacidiphilales bacterium]|nr:YdeI/OmpD-associated family protein [Candidatus Methylacidiphilales bacterium]
MNPKVDGFFKKARKWRKEMEKLREILLDCQLTEELKWGKPCYMFNGQNLVVILPLKNYCSLLLCKGALLKDPQGILIRPGENTQAARQIRFTDLGQITERETLLQVYVREAMEAEKAGLKVAFKKPADVKIPQEFQKKLKEMPALKAAFQGLTPGRQRLYLIHFSAAKQSKTRESRVEKCVSQILQGKGLNEEYR